MTVWSRYVLSSPIYARCANDPQSAIIFFFLLYTYVTTTSRTDGYAVYQYEFGTTMAVAAVMVATFFNGMNTIAWTGWVFFALGIGIVLIWAYTVRTSISMIVFIG